MKEKMYEKVLLFSGVLSSIGFPEEVRTSLEAEFGRIDYVSPSIPFTFTDYYNDEMGTPIERFFISFERLITPDMLSAAKVFRPRLFLVAVIYSLTSGLESSENSPISRKILRGWRMARGAFGRGLVKLKVPDTDVRAGGALV